MGRRKSWEISTWRGKALLSGSFRLRLGRRFEIDLRGRVLWRARGPLPPRVAMILAGISLSALRVLPEHVLAARPHLVDRLLEEGVGLIADRLDLAVSDLVPGRGGQQLS